MKPLKKFLPRRNGFQMGPRFASSWASQNGLFLAEARSQRAILRVGRASRQGPGKICQDSTASRANDLIGNLLRIERPKTCSRGPPHGRCFSEGSPNALLTPLSGLQNPALFCDLERSSSDLFCSYLGVRKKIPSSREHDFRCSI